MPVEIRGLARHLEKNDRRIDALGDLTSLMDKMGRITLSSVKANFFKGKTPEGKRWPPIAPKTRARLLSGRFAKPKAGVTTVLVGKTLLRTNRLLNSYKFKASKKSFRVFSNLNYAPTHQFGDRSRNIPKRRHAGISRRDRLRFQSMLLNHLTGTLPFP